MIYKPWAMISMCKEYRCKSVVNHSINSRLWNITRAQATAESGSFRPNSIRPLSRFAPIFNFSGSFRLDFFVGVLS
jgi:hypothetical protein